MNSKSFLQYLIKYKETFILRGIEREKETICNFVAVDMFTHLLFKMIDYRG